MAAAEKYPIERTWSGLQYLILGTEMRTRPNSTKPELPREGDQYIIPGMEPISTDNCFQGLPPSPSNRGALSGA